MKRLIRLSTAFLALVLSACGIGYNQTLFATTANVGIDIDTKPPTAEISIARREGVIAPTFQGGQHPPVYASFGLKTGGFLPLTTDVSGLFAGGRAAVVVSAAGPMKDDDYKRAGVLCLTTVPADSWLNGKFPDASAVQPMYFGTDTTYGLKIAWSGTAGPYPDSVKLGYNRKEFALAPLALAEHPEPGLCPTGVPYAVAMPSFLASVNSGLTAAGLTTGSKFDYAQFFATGASADNLAKQPTTRAAYQLKTFDAGSVTESAKKLVCFWNKDPAANGAKVMAFATANKVSLIDLLYDQSNEALQKQAAETFSASCS